MCELCEQNDGEMCSCQDCGRLICYDEQPNNIDVIDRAYVTMSGDLFCTRCGSRYDQEEEDSYEDEGDGWDMYSDSWYDPDMDFENEDSNGVYIDRDDQPPGNP